MKIDHYNTYPHGGAATAATRLHRELRRREVDSRLFYRYDHQSQEWDAGVRRIEFPDSGVAPSNPLRNLFAKRRRRRIHRLYDQHLAARDPAMEVFSMAELPELTPLAGDRQTPDVVHLHWISFLADYPSFFQSLDRSVPLVWTLHDMNPFTGGCHYSAGCHRYQKGCGVCPQVAGPGPRDVSRLSWEVKRDCLKGRRVAVVGPSQWIVDLAKSSPIWPRDTEFHHIRLGFDLTEFRPVDQAAARRRLGLDPKKVLVGFGADDISNPRKGFDYLLSALEKVRTNRAFECVVLGKGAIPATYRLLPPVNSVGYLSTAQQLADFYSACDFVVVPSCEDNQPQIGLEAMACGRPVIGFDSGGIPEYAIESQTGMLADKGDTDQLARCIERLVDDADRRMRLGSEARRWMETNCDLDAITSRYLELYRDMTATRLRRAA